MKKVLMISFGIVLAVALLQVSSFAQNTGPKIKLVTLEKPMGTVYPGIVQESIVISPDSQHVAYVMGRMVKDKAIADAAIQGVAVRGVAAQDEAVWLVVVDGEMGRAYNGIAKGSLRFSPNGKRLAYVAIRASKQLVVVDGVESSEYLGVGETGVIFSPDGKHLAFAAMRDGKLVVVVVDGVERKSYDNLGSFMRFSPDSKHLAYEAERGGKRFIVVDGVKGKLYDGIDSGTPIFSPDSRHVAYVAVRDKKMMVVVDGVEGKSYDTFLPSSTVVFDSPTRLHILAVQNGQTVRVDMAIQTSPKQAGRGQEKGNMPSPAPKGRGGRDNK